MGNLLAFNGVTYKNEEKYSGLSTSIVNTSEFIIMNIITVIVAHIGIKNDTVKE